MNIEERKTQNTKKIDNIQTRINQINEVNPELLVNERQELLQEALRLDGENRIITEMQNEE